MAFLQFYVKHRSLRNGRSVMETDWSSAFSYDYRAQSLASLVSLVIDALCEGTAITRELVDVMCAKVCPHVGNLARQWAAEVGDAGRRIPIVVVIDVEEEEVGGLIRFDYGAKITCYAVCYAPLAADYYCSSSVAAAAMAAAA